MATATTYDERVLEQARGLGTSTLYEASGISTAAVDSNIRTAWPGASIAGPAFPLECSPGDNLSIHIAMERVPRGTLAAARSVYPFAAHLMQEIDFCAIQAAVFSGAPVNLSSGRFRVDDTVYLPSGTVMAGEGDSTVLIWTRSVHSSDVFSMFLAERVTGIQMRDFSVADVSGSVGGYVVVGYNVRQLTIARVSTTGMAVAAFMPARDAYDSYDRVNIDENDVRFNGSSSLAVSRCNARDVARSDSPRAAVLFRYCSRWSAVDCTFIDVPFGVQWWGGFPAPARL